MIPSLTQVFSEAKEEFEIWDRSNVNPEIFQKMRIEDEFGDYEYAVGKLKGGSDVYAVVVRDGDYERLMWKRWLSLGSSTESPVPAFPEDPVSGLRSNLPHKVHRLMIALERRADSL